MVTSISDQEIHQGNGATAAGESARLTVTGLDEKGQMFRETAPIISLDGRSCTFRSKFQPELESWVLVELDLSKIGSKKSALQGQVKSTQSEGVSTNLYQIRVELEAAQDVKIVATPQPPKFSAQASPGSASKTEPAGTPKVAAPAPIESSKIQGTEGKTQVGLAPEVKPANISAPASREVPSPAPARPSQAEREFAKQAMTSEIKEQVAALKDSVIQELEQIAQRTVSTGMEQAIRQAVEKQIAVSYQAAIQTLNNDLAYQLVGRLASSDELRVSIEGMAKKALEEEIEASRNSAIDAQQKLNSRIAEITQSIDTSLAEMEERAKVAREHAAGAQERTQTVEREVAEATARLQKVGEQLNQAARTTIEKFDGHVTAQLNSWSVQFKNHLDSASREKVIQFSSELQQQLTAPNQQANDVLDRLSAGIELAQDTLRMQEEQANEVLEKISASIQLAQGTLRMREEQGNEILEKISAGMQLARVTVQAQEERVNEVLEKLATSVQLAQDTIRTQEEQGNEILAKLSAAMQLAQGTARIQEERLAELSRSAAANLEQEIKDVLLRLAGVV